VQLGLALAEPEADAPPAELTAMAQQLARADLALATTLAQALADGLPLARRDGGFVRAGHEPALDEALALRDQSRQVIAGLQSRYQEQCEARTLRIKHNNFLGFFVEVPAALGERLLAAPLSATFIHRQTMQGAMRFSTAELGDLEARIASAGERALQLELAIFDRLAAAVLAAQEGIKAISEALAALDVATALATLAERHAWTMPAISEDTRFHIVGGRHPVVEAAVREQGQSFIANDCQLADGDGTAGGLWLVTGPNMAGKSTFLRQNALMVVLAQMGSFVPAARAEIGIVDRLFSRVGAADDLARGRSTFMVEMVEAAAILNQAGPRSLVILDEIGRGTATFDGLSIAWAAIEHLHDHNRSRTLFATHYHELTTLAERLPRLVNVTMRVTEHRGDVIFLHEVVKGAADRSYGIQVAKLAGLPRAVVQRARAVLAELERADRQSPRRKLADDLPLFAAMTAPEPEPPAAAVPAALATLLDGLDPDELTPRQAQEALYALLAAWRSVKTQG
jgi:DNA mismatch repair protein MutS